MLKFKCLIFFFRRDSLFDHDNGDSSIIIIPHLSFNGSVFGNAIIVALHQNSIRLLTIEGISHRNYLRLILQHQQLADSLQQIRYFPNMTQSFLNMSRQNFHV